MAAWLHGRKTPLKEYVPPTRQPERPHTPIGVAPGIALLGEDFRDGTFLDKFLHRCVHQGIEAFGRPRGCHRLAIGSCLPTTDILNVILDLLKSNLNAEGISISFDVPYAFEPCGNDRQWLKDVQDTLGNEELCNFKGIAQLGLGNGPYCSNHNRHCPLPKRVHGLVASCSCRDTFKRTKIKTEPSHEQPHAFIRLLQSSLAEWMVIEIEDAESATGENEGLDLLLSHLADAGYDANTYEIDCSEYALPQRKVRIYVVAILRPLLHPSIAGHHISFFERVGSLMKQFKMRPPQLVDMLYNDSSTRVAREYRSRASDVHSNDGWTTKSINAHRTAWKSLNLRFKGTKADSADLASEWFQTLLPTERDAVAFNQASIRAKQHGQASIDANLTDANRAAFRIGSSLTNLSWGELSGNQLASPPIVPKTSVWLSIDRDNVHYRESTGPLHRLLLGEEALLIQGWPITESRWSGIVQKYSGVAMMTQASAMCPSIVIAALVAAVIFAIGFKAEMNDNDDEAATDSADACLVFKLFEGTIHRV